MELELVKLVCAVFLELSAAQLAFIGGASTLEQTRQAVAGTFGKLMKALDELDA